MKILWALVLALCAFAAQAQGLKIGFVNTERVFREAAPAKRAQQKLEREFAARNADIAIHASAVAVGCCAGPPHRVPSTTVPAPGVCDSVRISKRGTLPRLLSTNEKVSSPPRVKAPTA